MSLVDVWKTDNWPINFFFNAIVKNITRLKCLFIVVYYWIKTVSFVVDVAISYPAQDVSRLASTTSAKLEKLSVKKLMLANVTVPISIRPLTFANTD